METPSKIKDLQTDHVLINQQHHTNLFDVQSFRGANADTDLL
jgi:hypothetical protein